MSWKSQRNSCVSGKVLAALILCMAFARADGKRTRSSGADKGHGLSALQDKFATDPQDNIAADTQGGNGVMEGIAVADTQGGNDVMEGFMAEGNSESLLEEGADSELVLLEEASTKWPWLLKTLLVALAAQSAAAFNPSNVQEPIHASMQPAVWFADQVLPTAQFQNSNGPWNDVQLAADFLKAFPDMMAHVYGRTSGMENKWDVASADGSKIHDHVASQRAEKLIDELIKLGVPENQIVKESKPDHTGGFDAVLQMAPRKDSALDKLFEKARKTKDIDLNEAFVQTSHKLVNAFDVQTGKTVKRITDALQLNKAGSDFRNPDAASQALDELSDALEAAHKHGMKVKVTVDGPREPRGPKTIGVWMLKNGVLLMESGITEPDLNQAIQDSRILRDFERDHPKNIERQERSFLYRIESLSYEGWQLHKALSYLSNNPDQVVLIHGFLTLEEDHERAVRRTKKLSGYGYTKKDEEKLQELDERAYQRGNQLRRKLLDISRDRRDGVSSDQIVVVNSRDNECKYLGPTGVGGKNFAVLRGEDTSEIGFSYGATLSFGPKETVAKNMEEIINFKKPWKYIFNFGKNWDGSSWKDIEDGESLVKKGLEARLKKRHSWQGMQLIREMPIEQGGTNSVSVTISNLF